MAGIVRTAGALAFRDYITDGVSGSGKQKPVKSEVRRAFALVERFSQIKLASATVTAQPGSPADGALYILPAGKTGAQWGAMAVGSIAMFETGIGWTEVVPDEGWQAYDAAGLTKYLRKGGAWVIDDSTLAARLAANDNAFSGRASWNVAYTTTGASVLEIVHGSGANPVTTVQAKHSGVRVVRYLNKTQAASTTQEEGVQADALSAGSFIVHATPGSQQTFALKGMIFIGTQRNSGVAGNGDFVGSYAEAQRYGNYTDQIWARNFVIEFDTVTLGAVIGDELDYNNKSATDPGIANSGLHTCLSLVSGAEGRGGTAIWINRHGVYSNNEFNRGVYVKEYKRIGIQVGNRWHNLETNAAILGDQNVNGEYCILFRRATDSSPTGTFLALVNAANTVNLFTVGIDGRFQINNPNVIASAASFKQIANSEDTIVVERKTDSSPTGQLIRGVNAANNASLFYFAIDGRLQIAGPSVITTTVIGLKQMANSEDTLFLQRSTDSSPTGRFIYAKNAANNADIVKLDVIGRLWLNAPAATDGLVMVKQVANNESCFVAERFTDSSPTGRFFYARNAANNADIIKWDVAGRLSINAPVATDGIVMFKQIANNDNVIVGERNTDTSPTGNFLRLRDAANATTIFNVSIVGRINANGGVAGSNATALYTATQVANGEDGIVLKRFTDTSPTGQFFRAVNAANNANIVVWDVSGRLRIGAPGTVSAMVLSLQQLANGEDTLTLERFTETSPTGQFIRCIKAGLLANPFTVDMNATAGETNLLLSVAGAAATRVVVGAGSVGARALLI